MLCCCGVCCVVLCCVVVLGVSWCVCGLVCPCVCLHRRKEGRQCVVAKLGARCGSGVLTVLVI